MSDFFDNDNEPKNEETAQENEKVDFDESTVFSAPIEHSAKKTKKVKGKLLIRIISAFVTLAVLIGGTIAVIKIIPEKEEETPETNDLKKISLWSIEEDDASYLKVTNSSCSYEINKTEKTDDEGETTNVWILSGVDSSLVNSTAVSSLVTGILSVEAIKDVTGIDAEACGFGGNDAVHITIGKTDGKTVEFYIGNTTTDSAGYYLQMVDTGSVYLVDEIVKSDFEGDLLSFADASSIPQISETDGMGECFQDGTLSVVDSITFGGKLYPTPLVIVKNEESEISSYLTYKITSPEEHYADSIDEIFSLFQSGISANGAYSYDTSSTTLKAFGLNTPDIVLTVKLGTVSVVYKFAKTENDDYAVWSSIGKLIYKVSPDTISSLTSGDPSSYYSNLICLYSINDLSSFSVVTSDKTYTFGIAANEDDDEDNNYIITYNGKTLKSKNFQNLYQFVVSLSCYDFTIDSATSADKVSLVFGFKTGTNITVDFVRFNDTKYQYYTNGKPMGKVTVTEINKLIKNVKLLADGKTVGEIS